MSEACMWVLCRGAAEQWTESYFNTMKEQRKLQLDRVPQASANSGFADNFGAMQASEANTLQTGAFAV